MLLFFTFQLVYNFLPLCDSLWPSKKSSWFPVYGRDDFSLDKPSYTGSTKARSQWTTAIVSILSNNGGISGKLFDSFLGYKAVSQKQLSKNLLQQFQLTSSLLQFWHFKITLFNLCFVSQMALNCLLRSVLFRLLAPK